MDQTLLVCGHVGLICYMKFTGYSPQSQMPHRILGSTEISIKRLQALSSLANFDNSEWKDHQSNFGSLPTELPGSSRNRYTECYISTAPSGRPHHDTTTYFTTQSRCLPITSCDHTTIHMHLGAVPGLRPNCRCSPSLRHRSSKRGRCTPKHFNAQEDNSE